MPSFRLVETKIEKSYDTFINSRKSISYFSNYFFLISILVFLPASVKSKWKFSCSYIIFPFLWTRGGPVQVKNGFLVKSYEFPYFQKILRSLIRILARCFQVPYVTVEGALFASLAINLCMRGDTLIIIMYQYIFRTKQLVEVSLHSAFRN